jgi:hypothetical protein
MLEVVAGALLLGGLGLRYVSGVVAATLLAFTLAVVYNLARGRSFDCGCRAPGAPRTIGWGIVSRNAVLLAMSAIVAVWAPSVLALDALVGQEGPTSLGAGDAAALLVSTGLAVFALTLATEAFELRRAVVYTSSLRVASMYGGIPPGTAVPEFVAKDAAGSIVTTRELFPEPRLCLFVTTGCVPCATLLADLQASPDGLDVPLLVFVDDLHDPKHASLPPNVTVVEQADRAVSNAFQSRAFPQAFAVGSDRIVRGVAIPNSLADLRQLARALEGGDRRATDTQTAAA